LHYEVNPSRANKKSSKADITEVQYLQADLDPRPDETPAQGKRRFRKKLAEFGLQPTFLVDSGNGLNCLWKLAAPLPPERFDQVETTNKALVKALGSGDISAWNVDRLLRLPGTINLPNKAKREQGRVTCQSSIVHINDALTYTIEQVQAALDRMTGGAAKPSKPSTAEGGRSAEAKVDERTDVKVDDKRLPPELLRLIRTGVEEPRRSQQFFRVVHWLQRLGRNAAEITALLEKHPDGISSKYAGRVAGEVERAFAKVEGDKVEDEFEDESAEGKGKERKQADLLIDLAKAAGLFHTADGIGFADITREGHRETWPIHSKGFRGFLTNQYYDATESAPSQNSMNMALATIEAKAQYKSPQRPIHQRVAGDAGKIFLDLCDSKWRVVEIDATGWRLTSDPPVRFQRRKGMLPLPMPKVSNHPAGGRREARIRAQIGLLRKYLNLKSSDDFILLVAWLLACLRPCGPFPVLTLSGEQGTAKSTAMRLVRSLVDPNVVPLRAPPRDERDLYIAGGNARVLAYDNMSHLPDWMSDAFARLATGGGHATRMLYTDDDEKLSDTTCPIMLNGIEDVVTRGDLAERSVALQLEPIADGRRRRERELWAEFERDRALILGGLLMAVVRGLQRLPQVRIDKLPRMADFAEWSVACGDGLWKPGAFMRAYISNMRRVVGNVIADDPAAAGIQKTMLSVAGGTWSGTAKDLLDKLEPIVGEKEVKRRDWPGTARKLGQRLRRIAPALRRAGIDIDWERTTGGRRVVTITARNMPSIAPAPSSTTPTVLTVPTAPSPPMPPGSRTAR
jgi:hypothetical protein